MERPEHPFDPREPTMASRAGAPAPGAPPESGLVAASVGLLITGGTVEEALELIGRLRGALPSGSRAELIVLDDHVDPGRRALFDALRDRSERVHFVPRPDGGRVSELDAMTSMATCELMVVPTSVDAPFDALGVALHRMWVDGADAALVARGPSGAVSGLEVDGGAGRLAEMLGLAGARPPGHLVVVRRWVARWMLSEVDRALDPVEEFSDRGRLLGFALEVVVADGPGGSAVR